jgi:MarR family transcriptional regulator, organic hydroperoxide resistance regulator
MTRRSRSRAATDLSSSAAFGVDEQDVLRLDQQLCFALHAAARAYDGVYRRLLADTGLTYPQYLVMLVLWEHGELQVKTLGEYLRLDSGTLSPLLKRMESAGLVVRERSAHDERSVRVQLTANGRALKHRAMSVPLKAVSATGLSVDELIDLRTRLNRLTTALSDSEAQDSEDWDGPLPHDQDATLAGTD